MWRDPRHTATFSWKENTSRSCNECITLRSNPSHLPLGKCITCNGTTFAAKDENGAEPCLPLEGKVAVQSTDGWGGT